jgi:hypothetical protein
MKIRLCSSFEINVNKPLLHIHVILTFVIWATSVDPDQLAHIFHVICLYTVDYMVRNNLMNLKANSVDPDQTAQMFVLIWI